jgi:hypothetical protein
MGTMGTLELPARMSPCLRLFIEILFDEVDLKRSASWHQNHEIQSTTPKVIQTCTPSPPRGRRSRMSTSPDSGTRTAATIGWGSIEC